MKNAVPSSLDAAPISGRPISSFNRSISDFAPPLVWVTLVLLWLAMFNQLRTEWSINPQYYYGWAVPALTAYLLWKRWSDRPAPVPLPWPRWLRLCAGASLLLLLPTRLLQEANPDWRLVSWAAAIEAVLLTLIAFWHAGGLRWTAHFAFPITFAFLAVPWPSFIEQRLIQGLMRGIARISVEILNWSGLPAVQQGNLIELSTGFVGINEACSGVRSFQGMLMAALFLGEWCRLTWTRRFLLVLAGAFLALGFNLLRTLGLIWISFYYGADALRNWHDPAGYIVLLLTFICLAALSWLWQRHSQPAETAASVPSPSRAFPTAMIRAVLIWLVAVELTTEAWYRLHESRRPQAHAWTLRWPDDGAHFRFNSIPKDIQVILRYNEGKSAVWLKSDGTQWLFYFLRWSPGRTAAQLAKNHTPEICLPATGLKLVEDNGFHPLALGPIVLPVHSYTFDSRGIPLYVFYCSWEERARSAATLDMSRISRFRSVWNGQRHLGQQVLEVAISGADSQAQAQKQFDAQLRKMIQVAPGTT